MVANSVPILDSKDTIVALATPLAAAPVGVVRIAGPMTREIVQNLAPGDGMLLERRGAFNIKLRIAGFTSPVPARVLYYPGPRSYTGQDVAELETVSSPPLLASIVAQCLDLGARAAQPGEFTLRAFIAGKLDLTQAEAVLAVIESQSDAELAGALKQLAGGLAHPLRVLRGDLLDLLADVEAGLDFVEDDITFVNEDDLLRRIGNALAHLLNVKRQIQSRSLSSRPFRIAIAGPANVGKSSLFNALALRKVAIVSEQPGATRDYLEHRIDLDGVPVDIIDTAGLRSTVDDLERRAMEQGRGQIDEAELVLWCRSSAEPSLSQPAPFQHAAFLEVYTKTDRAIPPMGVVSVSIHDDASLAGLRAELRRRADTRRGNSMVASLARCRHHVDACIDHLRGAHELLLNNELPELLAMEIRLAIEDLGAMVGAVFTDDLLDRIFSRFCIGK